MSLNIKNEETVRLIRELAGELDLSLTAAVTDAVRARLDTVRAAGTTSTVQWDRAMGILAEMRERMGEEYLGQDFDALLYDEMGLPR